MVPLNMPMAPAQKQHEATTRAPRQLVGTDAECKPSSPGHLPATAVDSSSSGSSSTTTTNSSNNTLATDSDADTQSSRRPALSIQTGIYCLCGEELCGFDCHFLQQEFRAFAAAECRHRRRRHESKDGGVASEDAKDLHTSRKQGRNNTSDSDSSGGDSDDDEAVADLERRFRRHYSSTRSTTGLDDSTFDDMSTIFDDGASTIGMPSDVASESDAMRLPARMDMRRSKSCGVHSSEFDQDQLVRRYNAYRLRIGYYDEALRERSEKNTHALLQRAMSDDRSDIDSTATILARKALRYRKVLERMEGVDVTDPSLDVSKCLGVHWQRVSSSKQ